MALRLDTDLRNWLIDQLPILFNGGLLEIYGDVQPASADTAGTTLLATIELPDPAMVRVATGYLEMLGSWNTTATGAGRAAWARLRDQADTYRLDVGIGVGELEMDVVDLLQGQPVSITAFSIQLPGA